jgi:CDP-glucose 4,6-dehydratase
MVDMSFYRDRIVLLTGHTGFKGTWLSKILINAGAHVIGYSLNPPTNPNLFTLSGIENKLTSIIGDIRDYTKLAQVFDQYRPECVIHLAAQPIVRDSYKDPRYTYETNVMGTLNILECIRLSDSVRSFLNVTTDKVYLNDDSSNHAFKEDEPLDGYDPYSNSKSCSELLTHSYKNSFFREKHCAISTARAGNVIGGGDFANDRIIPDCIRSIMHHEMLIIRNPYSTRPYQHVLEPLFVYLEIIEKQYKDRIYEGWYNIGPDDSDCVNTSDLINLFSIAWGKGFSWVCKYDGGPHEASFLKLDNSKVKRVFDWTSKWNIDDAVQKTVVWTRKYLSDEKLVPTEMDDEIKEYLEY